MVKLLLWEIENRAEVSERQMPKAPHKPVVLTLTDNMETELTELRVTTPERELIVTLVEPHLEFMDGGLSVHGYVDRPRRRTDPVENWFARPIAEAHGLPVPWRVEVVEAETKHAIYTIEPATLEEVYVVEGPTGGRIRHEDLQIDEYLATLEERELMLLGRGGRYKKRWIGDFGIQRLLRFELTVAGLTKHNGKDTEVLLRLTLSGVDRAAALLGERPHTTDVAW